MAKGKRTGAAHKGYYAKYKNSNIHDKNAKIRLLRDLKNNPNNAEQINTAISNIKRTRCTPKTPFWNSTRRSIAILYKMFTGRVNQDIFSNNEKVSAPALMTPGPKSVRSATKASPVDFSLGARAFIKTTIA